MLAEVPLRHPTLRLSLSSLVATLGTAVVALPSADAGVSLSLRAGGGRLELSESDTMPILGPSVGEAVAAYNEAALAYNVAHGYSLGAADAAEMSTTDDVSLNAELAILTPSLDVSMGFLRARLDAPIGFGDDVVTVGLGVYPIGFAFAPSSSIIVPFAMVGAAAHYIDRENLQGALVEARVVAGISLRGWVSLEVGYKPYMVGAVVDRGLLDTITKDYDPTGLYAPDRPSSAMRGGVGEAIDISIGVSM